MDEATRQGAGEAHPRVHDFNAQREDRRGNGGDGNEAQAHARFYQENPQQERRAQAQVHDQATRIAEQSRDGIAAFTRIWVDAGSMTLGTAANFMLSWQRQMADFFSMRIEKDLQYGRRLIDARDPGELLRLNTTYGREAMSDYATCVSDIAQKTVSDAHQRGCQVVQGAEEAAERLRAGAERASSRT